MLQEMKGLSSDKKNETSVGNDILGGDVGNKDKCRRLGFKGSRSKH